MITNKYEETYYCVWKGAAQAQHINEVVWFLRGQKEPVSCATVGRAVFGEKYNQSYATRTGQMLKHLCDGGFVKYIDVKEEPIKIDTIEWITNPDKNGELPKLKVHDDNGNEYEIDNPKWRGSQWKGHWEKVKKTIVPTIRKYFWVEK